MKSSSAAPPDNGVGARNAASASSRSRLLIASSSDRSIPGSIASGSIASAKGSAAGAGSASSSSTLPSAGMRSAVLDLMGSGFSGSTSSLTGAVGSGTSSPQSRRISSTATSPLVLRSRPASSASMSSGAGCGSTSSLTVAGLGSDLATVAKSSSAILLDALRKKRGSTANSSSKSTSGAWPSDGVSPVFTSMILQGCSHSGRRALQRHSDRAPRTASRGAFFGAYVIAALTGLWISALDALKQLVDVYVIEGEFSGFRFVCLGLLGDRGDEIGERLEIVGIKLGARREVLFTPAGRLVDCLQLARCISNAEVHTRGSSIC